LTKKKILFVCLGNIVRSPLAENIFRDMVTQEGLQENYESASAGIEPWHVGEPPDLRMVRVAAQRGLNYSGKAKQISRVDLPAYDLILAMDHNNLATLLRLADGQSAAQNIRLLRDFDPQSERGLAVPDPYYGGLDGFETVFDIIKRSCRGLLDVLEREDRQDRRR
jgi:protein-tyrosine phosphatase